MTTMLFRSAFVLGLLTACFAQRPFWESSTSYPSDQTWGSTEGSATLPDYTGETSTSYPSEQTWGPTGASTTGPFPTGPEKRVQKPATYLITYSKTVRPGHPMVFQIQIFKGISPVDITIYLKDSAGKAILSHGPVTVWPMVPSNITLDIPLGIERPVNEFGFGFDDYTVEVLGEGQEVAIREKGRANFQEKAFSIFVQTDKAMYKPTQKVQFRTLAMTPDMKVLSDVKQDIVVFDSKGNRILQFRGVQASDTLGVFEKSFTLASSVPTGEWKITVSIEGVEQEKTFEVSDYVLPKFEVEVDGLPYGINSAILYEFTVRVTYTFGKPVTDGKVLVDIITDGPYYQNEHDRPRWTKLGKLDKNGEFKVQVPVQELKELGQTKYNRVKSIPDWWTFHITANATEQRTSKTHSGKHSMQFYATPIEMSILGITPDAFKSGLDYTAYIEVKKRDGSLFSPLELKNMSVSVNVFYDVPFSKQRTTTTSKPISGLIPTRGEYDDYYYPGGRHSERLELKLDQNVYKIPETGWIVVTFRVPEEATNLELQAKTESPYTEEVKQTKFASKSYSPTNSFLQLSVVNKKPRVGDTIQIKAKATDSMKLLTYQVFSKGLMLHASEVQVPSGSNNLNFQFLATKSMSPSMSIAAFYVREDGEIVVDALSLSVEGLFDDAVSVKFDKEKVQPGESVNLIVKGESGSLVFFLVIDKSVKLLKSGNDITQAMVMEELTSYDYGDYGNWRYMFICGWPSYFGGEDARSVFDNAGLIVMTDGLVYSRYNDQDYLYDDIYPEMAPGATMMPGVAEDTPDAATNKKPNTRPAQSTRKYFPENWLWNIIRIDSGGEVVVPLNSPDTITSWLASVFSVNPRSGLSIAEKPAEVITFRDMFISLDLPSFIVRGEDFCFNASVFSYYPRSIPILLTLEQNEGFTNILAKKENTEIILSKDQVYYSQFMGFLSENDVKTITFCFTPITIGDITIRVSALTDVVGLSDAVERKLRVKPEGFPHATTVSQLVTPDNNGVWQRQIPVQFPEDTVPGSERISVNIAGNLLGPIFNNLEDLLQKPYGCGEQNMINFSPIMSLVDFFFTTNTITDEFKQKAVDYMLIGYQKEMLYEHGESGGYSTFGNQANPRETASTWLTAFVTKCFSQAELLDMKYKNILAMDVNLIYRSALWMVGNRNQNKDGSFVENGKVFNKGLQGGSSNGIALTSYTVISLHHALKVLRTSELRFGRIESGMRKAVTFLEQNLISLTDPYDVCITTYALTLVNSNLRNSSFVKMDSLAKKGFGMTYWERPKQENTNTYYYWARDSEAINIEMTSYALLTYSLLGIGTTDGLPIIRWLSKQKGPNGGFISTQDTVIGIEALTSVAKELYGADFVPMTITVLTRDNGVIQSTHDFQVTKENEMILQRNDIPYKNGSTIEITAQTEIQDSSKSTVLVDVVFNYNVIRETQSATYGMSHQIRMLPDILDLWISIWTTNGKTAGMSILEVDIPAGYTVDEEEILRHDNGFFISEMDKKEDRINIYINTDVIGPEDIKIKVAMVHNGGTLTKAKGKTYKVYDYYEPENELTKEYFLTDDKDFCDKVPEFSICKYK